MKKYLLLFALLLSGWATPSLAQSLCVEVTSLPVTISVPGNYCLIGNQTVNMNSGNAITIAANDVVLDCLNFSIRNLATAANGSSNAINITNRNTVTVKNCRILGGFTSGIWAYQNNAAANANYYINLVDNYIAGPFWYGILAYGSAIEIRNNRIYDVGGQLNGFAMGIRVAGSNVSGQPRFHIVKDNLIAGTNSPYNNAYGVYSDNSTAGIFIDNGISGTSAGNASYRSYGVRLGGLHNRVTDNHIVGPATGTNDMGVFAGSTTNACFDNYLRSPGVKTQGCDATLGNY